MNTGVLVLHGFAGYPTTVDALASALRTHGYTVSQPTLRGHGGRPDELDGVTYLDWLEDARAAYAELAARVDRVVIAGLSMGGLVTLHLASENLEKLAAIVTAAAALHYKDPLAPLSPFLGLFFRYWPMPAAPRHRAYEKAENHPYFPVKTFTSMRELGKVVESRLSRITVPALIMHSRKDHMITPESAEQIHRDIRSSYKDLEFYEHSGHELFLDWDREAAIARTLKFLEALPTG